MNKYYNKINVGMTICEKYEEKDGNIVNILGITNHLKLNNSKKTTFALICDFNFVEFEIPKGIQELSFKFFIRTLGGETSYIIPFITSEMKLSEEVDDVMTHQMSMRVHINEFEFPRKGTYAIEIYKYYGKIDSRKESTNMEYYRKTENFINAISFEVI